MSKRSSPILRLVAILGIGAIITIGTMFLVMVLGAADNGVDMSGSDYEGEYNSTTDISITSIGLMKFLPMIIGVCALLVAVVGLKKYTGF